MMNRKLLHIILIAIILALSSCAGESQDKSARTNVNESAKMSDDFSEEVFTELENPNAELAAEQLEAFQLRAIQKFQDFLDYLKIISNPDVDNDLKEHSLQLAIELFMNDSTLITDSIITVSIDGIILKDYLEKIKSNKNPIFIGIEKIGFSEPLELDSLNNYKGKIEVSLKIKESAINKKVAVYLIQIEKSFGQHEVNINEVKLGNIY